MSNLKHQVSKLDKSQKGVVLVTVLMISLLLTFVGLSMADVAIAQLGRTNKNVYTSNALLVAEAGAEQTLSQIADDNDFLGYTTETQFYNDTEQGRGTYQTTVTDGTGPNEKVITSTGKVYKYDNPNIYSMRKVRVSIVGTLSNGYSVFSGPGGLILGGNAILTNSDIHVNGYITMNGNAQIGTAANPKSVEVANYNCPTGSNPGPTYPQLCTSGEPITISGGNAKIYGTVCATNQTNSTGIFTGTGGQGLVSGCVAPTTSQPPYDRADHIAGVTTTGSASAAAYKCNGNDVKTWPGNLRLNGNVGLTGNCQLTITGNVYITGNFSGASNTIIKVADSLGTTRPVILTDGTIDIAGSTTFIPNSSGTGVHLISFKSTAACSPSCTSVTGTDLKNSQSLQTINVGGNGTSPGVIFQAYWSKINMAGNGVSGAAIGQTVEFSGNGNIVLGTVLSSGTSTWTVRSYQYDYDY